MAGGKGGVGKSTIALNLAIANAQAGARTLLVDSDLGLAGLNLLLGVAPMRTILDALGGVPIDEVLLRTHEIELLPALNGSYLLSTLGAATQQRILDLIASLRDRFDRVVIDIAAGIGRAQTAFAGATKATIIVVGPEPSSVAGAYACLKVLASEQQLRHAYIVPNAVESAGQAHDLVGQLGALVARFLDIELTAMPRIPIDPTVGEAARQGVPLLVHAPRAPAALAIRQLLSALA